MPQSEAILYYWIFPESSFGIFEPLSFKLWPLIFDHAVKALGPFRTLALQSSCDKNWACNLQLWTACSDLSGVFVLARIHSAKCFKKNKMHKQYQATITEDTIMKGTCKNRWKGTRHHGVLDNECAQFFFARACSVKK